MKKKRSSRSGTVVVRSCLERTTNKPGLFFVPSLHPDVIFPTQARSNQNLANAGEMLHAAGGGLHVLPIRGLQFSKRRLIRYGLQVVRKAVKVLHMLAKCQMLPEWTTCLTSMPVPAFQVQTPTIQSASGARRQTSSWIKILQAPIPHIRVRKKGGYKGFCGTFRNQHLIVE